MAICRRRAAGHAGIQGSIEQSSKGWQALARVEGLSLSESSELPVIEPDDFARRFSLRAPKLMWFLGAGASAAAGIPTAGDMIWEFKQRLYITQRAPSPSSVA